MHTIMIKKILVIITFVLPSISLLPRPVFATDVAGSAGTLAYHMPAVLPDSRVEKLRSFLLSYDSPLAGEASTFISEAEKHNLDWKLVAAIAGVESTFGRQIPGGSYNAWGWGIPTGAPDGIHFKDWSDGIAQVSEGLEKNYFGRGAKDIYEVGWIYAANGNSWGNHVRFFIDKISSFQPVTPDLLAVSI